ncbi:hypothetical protein D1872_81700 [compost metagenome]
MENRSELRMKRLAYTKLKETLDAMCEELDLTQGEIECINIVYAISDREEARITEKIKSGE